MQFKKLDSIVGLKIYSVNIRKLDIIKNDTNQNFHSTMEFLGCLSCAREVFSSDLD